MVCNEPVTFVIVAQYVVCLASNSKNAGLIPAVNKIKSFSDQGKATCKIILELLVRRLILKYLAKE